MWIIQSLADATADQARREQTASRKVLPEDVKKTADHLNIVWDFGVGVDADASGTNRAQGHFITSPFFYGSYGNTTYIGKTVHYSVPLAYFLVNLFILGYSFFAILSK